MDDISRDSLIGHSQNSIYKLVVMAIKRSIEIAEGAPKLIDADLGTKVTTVSLEEIASGKVSIKKPKD